MTPAFLIKTKDNLKIENNNFNILNYNNETNIHLEHKLPEPKDFRDIYNLLFKGEWL